jgi:hypothetical protein
MPALNHVEIDIHRSYSYQYRYVRLREHYPVRD